MFKIFRPLGKVHPKYNQFMAWSFASNVISSTQYVLATHSMLCTIGKDSNEFNLSYNYIFKDVIGQVGGLYYINKTCTKSDKDTKKYIKETLAIQQASIYIECITPIVPSSLFLLVAGIGNVGKNITATGLGASNAKIIQKLAQEDNLGEIYAKINILNTLGSSVGMIAGLVIVNFVPDHSMRLCLMPILSGLRFWTFNKALEDLI